MTKPIAKWMKNSYIQFFEGYPKEGTFLYAHPIAPLTEDRITEIAREFGSFDVTGRLLKLVRGIEQAHGIKESS